ncbi:MAG: hypothetical protein ACTSP0_04560 [Alphaproteobacteria bacterium]
MPVLAKTWYAVFAFIGLGWIGYLVFLPVSTPANAQTPAQVRSYASRPDPTGKPTDLSVGVYILDITQINDAEQTFFADVGIRVRWRDKRLSHADSEPRLAPLDSIWHPRIVAFNARQVVRGMPEEVTIESHGLVTYIQRFSGTFSVRLDLHKFPKDEQTVSVRFLIQGLGPEQLNLTVDDEWTAQAPKFTITDWHIEKGLALISPIEISSAATRPGFAYEFNVTRNVGYYRLKIISTLVLIVLMAWVSFWMKTSDIAPKLAMGASAMLTLIAYRFYLSGLVPKVSYMTRMDYFVMGATVLVFASLIGVLVINFLERSKRTDLTQKTENVCRVAVPVALALLIVILEQ